MPNPRSRICFYWTDTGDIRGTDLLADHGVKGRSAEETSSILFWTSSRISQAMVTKLSEHCKSVSTAYMYRARALSTPHYRCSRK